MNNVIPIALMEYGVKEIPGGKDNPDVLKYFDYLGFDGSKLKDETSWCSAFANYCAKMAGYPYSGKLTARSWLKVGEEECDPKIGDIVVFWRESINSWKGHVGFYINHDEENIYVLGGNQNNMVRISAYPAQRLLGYRRISQRIHHI